MAVALAVLGGALVWQASDATFTATTSNSTNTWKAGTVRFAANSPATALWTITNAIPGSFGSSCVVITYIGTVNAAVRLYLQGSDLTGTGLAPYLTFSVSAGSGTSSTCSDFVVSGTALYNTTPVSTAGPTLAGFSTTAYDYPTGIDTWTATPNTTRTYRFDWQVQDRNAAQNLTANAIFTWEAHS